MSLLRPNQWCEMIADGTCIFVIVMSAFFKTNLVFKVCYAWWVLL